MSFTFIDDGSTKSLLSHLRPIRHFFTMRPVPVVEAEACEYEGMETANLSIFGRQVIGQACSS